MNFCVEDNFIELVMFWLDMEHFDGNTDDMRLFTHHVSNLLLEESPHFLILHKVCKHDSQLKHVASIATIGKVDDPSQLKT